MVNYMTAKNETSGLYLTIYDLTGDMISLGRSAEALNLTLDKSRKHPPKTSWDKTYMLLSLAQCYEALHKNPVAEKYCEELIKLTEQQKKQREISEDVIIYQYLASFYFGDRQYEKAEKYFKKTLAGWPKSGKDAGMLYQTNFQFKLDSARGNFRSAFTHLRKFHKLKDSIVTVARNKQIEELKIMYQTGQKDSLINLNKQNILLLTKQDQLQKSQLRQGNLIRNISFAVAGLLVSIIVLLYNRYRLKQRTNKKLELQQDEIAQQNHSLQHLLNEKEWLLKEIHHRVKNNLQIVMSLLNSQSAYIDNEPALTAIHDSQHRVHAMSLIHQKIYGSESVSSIDMSYYIRELTSYLADSFNTGQRIRFEFNLESLEMDVAQAVPLGLILNEAITNAIKYAFPDGNNGVIFISLTRTAPNHSLLCISDNGIGMPPGYSIKKPGSLGMSLMAGLSEDLDGHFSIESDRGTTIKISFVCDPGSRRSDALTESFVSNN
jgi:two-component sensor histidine kinase